MMNAADGVQCILRIVLLFSFIAGVEEPVDTTSLIPPAKACILDVSSSL